MSVVSNDALALDNDLKKFGSGLEEPDSEDIVKQSIYFDIPKCHKHYKF